MTETEPQPLQLFDLGVARVRRDEAIHTVGVNAEGLWREAACVCVRWLAHQRAEFTTDAVWFLLETSAPSAWTHEPRAMGPVMRWATREGLVVKTDRSVQSTRVRCHARPVAVWRSLVFEP